LGQQRQALSAEQSFNILARMTARLSSTARLDEIVDTVLEQIVELGFGAVWMASLDESTGMLRTLKEVIDGVDTTHEMPEIWVADLRQPVGHGFRERRLINIVDPESLYIIERDDDQIPLGKLALPRVIYEHLRGHPFACGPVLGSRGQPVGAVGLSSYLGNQPIPDEILEGGLLRAFLDHLGIAMERAANITKLERLNADLVKAQATIATDARIKAVGELAAAVAHDLNNLSGVALMAISVGERSPADAYQVLPRIARANRAIGELVARLQRVARTGAAHDPGQVADPQQIVDDVLALVSPVLRERGVELEQDLPPVSPVRADPVLIHQIALNLVLNAQEAMQSVSAYQRRLRVSLREVGDEVVLTVADTGPGIAPEVLSQLFQSFVTTKPGHAGLGLAAAHASLKHFGGRIEGRNKPDGGAVFEVTLVRAPEARVAPVAAARASERSAQRSGKILVVDDDPDIVTVVCAFLEPLGYEVTTASSADQAIELAAAKPFDIVICDVGMPQRNGLEAAEMLQRSGFRGKLVLMTGWDSTGIRNDRRAAEADLILAKPFLGAELLEAIDSLLAR
jgi:signal transduction histidine kinase/CheY-like chemotaxis protein